MKNLLSAALLCALAGCASAPSTSYQQPRDPSQWRVVSVTPVPNGTAARIAATSPTGKAEEFTSTPVSAMPPAYAVRPAPLYSSPYVQGPAYYRPPVTLGLGFMFGRHGHGGGGRHHGGSRRH
ncbi:MAG: hypothetical protein V4631_12530 [Pseudomonadota bacterium]